MENEYVKIYVEVRYNVFDETLNKISVDKKHNLDNWVYKISAERSSKCFINFIFNFLSRQQNIHKNIVS